MAGSTKTVEDNKQAATSTNTIDPQEKQMLMDNYAGAQTRASTLTPYTGQMVAGFNPTQTQAQGVLSGIATDPRYAATNAGAISSAQGVLGTNYNSQITPQAVSPQSVGSNPIGTPSLVSPSNVSGSPIGNPTHVSATPVNAGMLAGTDLSPYMNPYTSSVIDASVAQNERARQAAGVTDAQRATAEGAFGGSRSGVASALTNQLYDQNNQSNIANLNSANFSQAQAGALGDINRKFSADQYNSGQNLNAQQFNSTGDQNAAQFNSGQNYNAQIANQNAGLNSGEFNSGVLSDAAKYNSGQAYDAQIANQAAGINTGEFNATNNQNAQQSTFNNQLAANGLTMNAAGQIVALNNASLGTVASQAGILGSVGDTQQAQSQASLSAAYQAYMDGQQLTAEQQQMLNSALGLIPNQQTITSSGTSSGTSTQTKNPGLVDILGAVGSLGMGLGKSGLGLSDGRTKYDVQTIGHDDRGRRWVSYKSYIDNPGVPQVGVIAQEIIHSDPDAVVMGDDGLYRVNYSKLGGAH